MYTSHRDTRQASPSKWAWMKGQVMLAALLEVLVFNVALAITGRYPFGDIPYGVGDAGWQLLPFYGSYWDMLHMQTASSPMFNWDLGLGVPFFGDWATYAASPFFLLLAFFPRHMLEFALVFITGLVLALAAASMTAFLQRLIPGARFSWFWGIAWASTGWIWDFGIFRTMWLQGLIVLPLLALAAVWAWNREHFYLTVVVVAFAWTGNYYTAYMVSLAAGLFAVAYIIDRGLTQQQWRWDTLYRFVGAGILGGLLSAWILIPTLKAVQNAIPFGSGRPWSSIDPLTLTRTLFPGASVLYDTPNLFFGVLGIFAFFLFFFSASIGSQTKVVWSGVVVLLGITMFWSVLAPIWSLFEPPNGSWFRASFVLVFFCVLLAFQGFETVGSESWKRLVSAGAVVVVLLGVAGFASEGLNPGTVSPFIMGSTGVVLAAVVIFLLSNQKQSFLLPASAIMVLALCAEVVITAQATTDFQTSFLGKVSYRSQVAETLRTQIGNAGGKSRVAYFENADLPWNQGPAYGVSGTSYYSSLVPKELGVDLARRYGFNWQAGGRMVRTGEDPIAGVISASSSIVVLQGNTATTAKIETVPFARRVTEALDIPVGNPLQARAALLGTTLYGSAPKLTAVDGQGVTSHPKHGESITFPANKTIHITAQCGAASYPQFLVPSAGFGAQVDTRNASKVSEGVILSGRSHKAVFHLVSAQDTQVPSTQFVCASYQAASAAVKKMEAAESSVDGSSLSIKAEDKTPIIVATAYSPNWECDSATTDGDTGFLRITPRKAGEISCHYQTPGLVSGAAVSGLTLLGMGAFAIWKRRRAHSENHGGAKNTREE